MTNRKFGKSTLIFGWFDSLWNIISQYQRYAMRVTSVRSVAHANMHWHVCSVLAPWPTACCICCKMHTSHSHRAHASINDEFEFNECLSPPVMPNRGKYCSKRRNTIYLTVCSFTAPALRVVVSWDLGVCLCVSDVWETNRRRHRVNGKNVQLLNEMN